MNMASLEDMHLSLVEVGAQANCWVYRYVGMNHPRFPVHFSLC